jgi:hypothetical protein
MEYGDTSPSETQLNVSSEVQNELLLQGSSYERDRRRREDRDEEEEEPNDHRRHHKRSERSRSPRSRSTSFNKRTKKKPPPPGASIVPKPRISSSTGSSPPPPLPPPPLEYGNQTIVIPIVGGSEKSPEQPPPQSNNNNYEPPPSDSMFIPIFDSDPRFKEDLLKEMKINGRLGFCPLCAYVGDPCFPEGGSENSKIPSTTPYSRMTSLKDDYKGNDYEFASLVQQVYNTKQNYPYQPSFRSMLKPLHSGTNENPWFGLRTILDHFFMHEGSSRSEAARLERRLAEFERIIQLIRDNNILQKSADGTLSVSASGVKLYISAALKQQEIARKK